MTSLSSTASLAAAFTFLLHAASAQAPAASVPAAVTITVETGARQNFNGLGASMFPWTPSVVYNVQVTPAQTRHMARLLWHDAHLHSVRLWMHPGQEPVDFYIDGYMKTGKLPAALAAGATDLILAPDHVPDAMGDGQGLIKDAAIPVYAALLAGFIRQFQDKTGILINNTGVLNEPNDRPVRFSNAQWPLVIKDLRAALDTRGLQAVGIVAPESANCGADAYAVVDAIKADPAAWNALAGIATHSYNNAATPEMAARTRNKSYWITEAGGITDTDEDAGDAAQAASLASRLLNDVNHGVTHWQFFIGAEQADPHGNTGRILKYDVAPFRLTILQKYYVLKQLSETFDLGAAFRHSRSSLEGEMTYTYGKKPRLTAAAARNPDGSWGIGLSNYTAPPFRDADDPADFALHNSGYHAQSFSATVRVPELKNVPTLRFIVHRSGSGLKDARAESLVMHQGRLTVEIAPLELVTLRSADIPATTARSGLPGHPERRSRPARTVDRLGPRRRAPSAAGE